MKTLQERQLDRVVRKAERAIADGDAFDASRAGIGKVRKWHPDAAKINEATDAAIARTAEAIGAAPARLDSVGFPSHNFGMVKVAGI